MHRIGLFFALALGLAAHPRAAFAQSVPADMSGQWIVQSVQPAPWAPKTAPDRQLVGWSISFNAGNMAGPNVFACANAKYEMVPYEPRNLFQGNLSEATAERDAKALGIPNPAPTLSVTCDSGIFDFHKAGNDLVIGFDNQTLRLRRAGK